MGLPSINIVFKAAANSLVKRTQKGVVALILREEKAIDIKSYTIKSIDQIPTDKLSDDNIEQIKLAMRGSVNPPSKIIIYLIDKTTGKITDAMKYFQAVYFNYIAAPGSAESDNTDIATWIKQLRSDGKRVKAVLAGCKADHEGIINFTTNNIKLDETREVSASEYCSRIAGILAGMPLHLSSTYQVLPEVLDVPHESKEEFDNRIDAGELVLINDGEKVKIARGVNSFVNPVPGKGPDFKKIKIVDAMDMIDSDIRNLAQENYIGKMPNVYDNKCLLITAIKVYYEELEREQILDRGKNTIGIDLESQTGFLKVMGKDVENMDQQQIKEGNTKDQVFLSSNIKIVDAMESINLNINM